MPDREQDARRLNMTGKPDERFEGMDVEAADSASPWSLYDELICAIPDDVLVKDYVLGVNWSCLEAECGAGVAYTVTGGAAPSKHGDLRGSRLRDVAALAKSWCFAEATIGVAALNAWHGREKNLLEMDALFEEPCETPCRVCDSSTREAMKCLRDTDAFDQSKHEIEAFPEMHARQAKVVVVGHFPRIEDMGEYCDITILERRCRDKTDMPDPGCEYVLPCADYAFLTGVTLINKTMPRLLELSKHAKTAIVGPSAVASSALLDRGVNTLAGKCVVDYERVRFSCASGEPFGDSLLSFIING